MTRARVTRARVTRASGGIVTLVGVAVLALGCSAGSDDAEPAAHPEPTPVERVVVGSFDTLKIADGFQVQVERGAESQATVSISGIPAEQIEAVVKSGTLELRNSSGSVPPGAVLRAEVVVPTLTAVTATSGAKVALRSGLSLGPRTATVDLTTGARFLGEVSAESFSVVLQAGARAEVRGSARKASINGSESGVLVGGDLDVADAKVTLSTSATVELSVRDTLDVSISSGSKLLYAGDPKITRSEIESGATLESSSK